MRVQSPLVLMGLMIGCAALLAASPPARAQSPTDQSEATAGGAVLWTTKPVRVNREAQSLPRAPARNAFDLYPLAMYVPKSVRVSDSTTFKFKGITYRLANIAPLPPRMICRDVSGRRWACGLRARMSLRAMIAGKQIHCRKIDGVAERPVRVACILDQNQIAVDLVRAGFARAMEPIPPFLLDPHRFAVELRAGIWSDAATAATAN